MRKNKNKVHLEGFLYEHNLEVKVSGPTSKVPNTTFISGTISIATDDECVNIVPVHFTYVTATTSKGGPNATFNTLKNIHDGIFGSVMGVGKENAVKLVVDSALALNEFYAERNGVEELVSSKRAEGGFVHKVEVVSEDPSLRNYFEVDMVITNAVRKEADEETFKIYPLFLLTKSFINSLVRICTAFIFRSIIFNSLFKSVFLNDPISPKPALLISISIFSLFN